MSVTMKLVSALALASATTGMAFADEESNVEIEETSAVTQEIEFVAVEDEEECVTNADGVCVDANGNALQIGVGLAAATIAIVALSNDDDDPVSP